MAKHATPHTAAGVRTASTIIRPVALSAAAYLDRLRTATTTVTPASMAAGRHSR
ncbi:hypothetical protein [Actinomycetospora straminea]|uniref:Uncharacterized protein n=1 Tax=Actinomycetospora straminea TaxID=663607 RepID=A0ABP9E375_9PSEU|nr:hypothetical protein [Actinomycetospora straminea]MDD7931057.1 hypothetical protein [Actinomycetospora straminea]